jgi:hypothetical protein
VMIKIVLKFNFRNKYFRMCFYNTNGGKYYLNNINAITYCNTKERFI